MDDFIKDRCDCYEVLTGEKKAPEPSIICFKNARIGCNMLYKHIKNNSLTLIHGDVDCDGIGSAYIVYRFMKEFVSKNRLGTCINKHKIHGIGNNHIDFFNKTGAELVIIVDSGTNDIEYIKKLNCDVLVVDHHEILNNELHGKTVGGEYIIVNNNIDNDDFEFDKYTADDRMSGALVLYEMLRLYQHMFKVGDILKGKMLYQWVGLTLFTDSVNTLTLRNQYYLDLTVHNMDTEYNLKRIMSSISSYQSSLDKSFIQYQIGPTFNRAIRAGYGGMALDDAIRTPEKAVELRRFQDVQNIIASTAYENVIEYSQYAMKELIGDLVRPELMKKADTRTINTIKNIQDTGMGKNYCGLMANKILGKLNKSTVVFIMNGNYAEGSFRGKYSSIDYRKFFDDWGTDVFAQGHKSAFGFKAKIDELPSILLNATNMESQYDTKEYLTAGRLIDSYKGKHHIDDFDTFKKEGLLWRLAIANSKLSTEDSINIIVPTDELKPPESKGKAFIYKAFGFECLAFEEIVTPLAEIYVEYAKEIKFYIRNKWR